MPYIQGSIPVTGFIGPTDSNDTYAVTDAIYGIDGYRSLSSTTARNLISTERRREGMLVYTQVDQNIWQLLPGPWSGVDADWKLFISSAVTGSLSATTGFLALSGGTLYGNLQMSSSTVVRSTNGGGQLDLDYAGAPGEVLLSNDNGAWSNESQLYLSSNTIELSNYDTGGTLSLYGGFDSAAIGQIRLGSLVDGVKIQRLFGLQRIDLTDGAVSVFSDGGSISLDVANGEVMLKNNPTTNETSGIGERQSAIFIGTENSFINSGVTNSVIVAGSGHTIISGLTNVGIVGGKNISATTSNTFYTQNARLAENGGIIYSAGTPLQNIFASAGSGILTASNGLTKSGNNVTLGGALTGDTYIDSVDSQLIYSVSGVGNFTLSMSNGSGQNTDSFFADSSGIINNAIVDDGFDIRTGTFSHLADSTVIQNLRDSTSEKPFVTTNISTANSGYTEIGLVIGSYFNRAALSFHISGTTFDDTLHGKGINYLTNYHSGYTDRTLVDKEYVDNTIASGSPVNKYTTTTTLASSGTTITHNLGTNYIICAFYDSAGGPVTPQFQRTNANTISVTAATTATYDVVIHG